MQSEIFGPVLVVLPFDSDDEGIALANDTPYGLAASAWSRDVYRTGRATREIKAGCVWVNDHIPIISEMPHGGAKASGFGKDMSAYSFEEYTQVKHVMYDNTAVARKDWHRTVFGDRLDAARPPRPTPAAHAHPERAPRMEHHEPERLSAAQLAAMRRSLTERPARHDPPLPAAGVRRRRATVGGLGALAACGIPPAGPDGTPAVSEDHSEAEKRLSFSNWTEYMDVSEDGKHRPTLERFTRRTGIKVKYTEDINDNDEFFGKIQPQLAAGQDTGRDLIVLTDWLAARHDPARLGRRSSTRPTSRTPTPTCRRSSAAPTGTRAAPTPTPGSGIPTVIAYNKKATGGRKVDSVSQLLEDPELKGRVGFLSEMRDTRRH